MEEQIPNQKPLRNFLMNKAASEDFERKPVSKYQKSSERKEERGGGVPCCVEGRQTGALGHEEGIIPSVLKQKPWLEMPLGKYSQRMVQSEITATPWLGFGLRQNMRSICISYKREMNYCPVSCLHGSL